MEKNNSQYSFILCFLLVFLISCSGDSFIKLDEQDFNISIFSRTVDPIDIFLDEGFKVDREEAQITILDSTGLKEVNLRYSALVRFVDSKYIGVVSGLSTFDAGWRYLVSPTYSRLVIIRKEDMEIVFSKRVNKRVSDMALKDDQLFFKYGKFPNFKYGKFNFSD